MHRPINAFNAGLDNTPRRKQSTNVKKVVRTHMRGFSETGTRFDRSASHGRNPETGNTGTRVNTLTHTSGKLMREVDENSQESTRNITFSPKCVLGVEEDQLDVVLQVQRLQRLRKPA